MFPALQGGDRLRVSFLCTHSLHFLGAPGIYTIDVDGPEGGTSPQKVHCNMEVDGGWTLIASMRTTAGYLDMEQSGVVVERQWCGCGHESLHRLCVEHPAKTPDGGPSSWT